MSEKNTSKALVWFRQDLRLHDNPALFHACKNFASVTALYIFDEESSGVRKFGGAQKWWLHHSLTSLKKSLKDIGINLLLFKGSSEPLLKKFVEENDINALYWNKLYEPYYAKRDEKIKTSLQKNIEVNEYNGYLLAEPWQAKNKSGEYFKVFTPFYKHNISELPPAEPLPLPEKVESSLHIQSDSLDDWELLPTKPNWAKEFSEHFTPGEENARKTFADFLENRLEGYAEKRDFTDGTNTSQISPYLHFGEISIKVMYYATLYEKHKHKAKVKDADKYISELYWREFSYHLLHHFENFAERNFREQFDNFPWDKTYKHLKQWQKGLTGYPIVDAGMRQLWRSGWMHNRVRMIVASFLIKHLQIDWRKGEEWFWDTLLDANLANNVASWQWVAGSGADAAPYFRIFNPIMQGKKFDKTGEYVRQWVPELAKLPDEYLHNPWEAPELILRAAGVELGKNYPKPIVNHEKARDIAMSAFKSISK